MLRFQFAILVAAFSLACGPATKQATAPPPSHAILSLSPDSLDFGAVAYGAHTPLPITATNTGTQSLSIQSEAVIDDTGYVFSVTNMPIKIAAGASTTIYVTLLAPAVAGTYLSNLIITSNSDSGAQASVPLSVTVNAPAHAGTDGG